MGIFDKQSSDVFATYHARLTFRDKVMGGTPKNPKIIEGWLRSKAGMDDAEEIQQASYRTLVELGVDVHPEMTYEELEVASNALAASRQTNGFKQDENGLYIESRTVKAMLKEATNILYAGDRWGRTKKGPRSFLAERVFINPDHISLGVMEPSGIEMFIGHTSGPKGPQSNLTYIEYVTQPTIEFDVMVLQDAIEENHWPELWLCCQENGLGSLRSQGFGRFDVEQWDVVREPTAIRQAA